MKSYQNKSDKDVAVNASSTEGQTSLEEATATPSTIDETDVTEEESSLEDVAATSSTTDEADAPEEESSPSERSSQATADAESEDDADVAGPSWKDRFFSLNRRQVLTAVAFGSVFLLAAVLRFWALGDKPLHHDESEHAYFSWQFMLNILNRWGHCYQAQGADPACYHYDPLLHGPFQFHIIAFVYKISQLLGVYDNGVNNVTARIAAASLGTVIVGLPYFLRDRLGIIGTWLACFLLAVSPSMVYFSRFTREDIYMACFTLLTVVAIARYLSTRKASWLVIAAVALSLSYATKEATFLTIAVFGSFFGALLAWELGSRWPIRRSIREDLPLNRFLPQTGASVVLLLYFLVLGAFARWFFAWLKQLAIYVSDPSNTPVATAYVQGLKDRTVALVPWIGILLGISLLFIIVRELLGMLPPPGRRGLATYVDPERQPLLDTVVTMPWTHWFMALLCGWSVFLILYTVLFTNIRAGIGDGIWQGIYYWLQQQQVARGGQPWYYYLLLIPLYEQIGVVFGLVGLVRCLLRPTRFRLFLVYWFVGNLFIYSWAAEKMPWLMIHLTMPLLLLAAIGLEPIVVKVIDLAKNALRKRNVTTQVATNREGNNSLAPAPLLGSKKGIFASGGAVLTVIIAVLLLLPTVHNMYEVTYVHPADAPHEMMIYVQTTTDVDIVMNRIEQLDQKYYGGKHTIPIGLMSDSNNDGPTWPFAWYLRDYTNVCFNFPGGCATRNIPVIITGGGDSMPRALQQYGAIYAFHRYHMRTQWDQGYMPPPCQPTPANPCTEPQQYIGVGPFLWLSYGDNPPPNAKFDLGRAASNVWQWWWNRKPIGSTEGSYDMGLFIRKDLGVAP